MRKRLLLVPAILAAVSIVAFGASLLQASEQQFTGCLTTGGTLVRVAVGVEPLRPCTPNQTEVTWNQQGPAGAPGVPCSVSENPSGHFTLTCPDGTSVSWEAPVAATGTVRVSEVSVGLSHPDDTQFEIELACAGDGTTQIQRSLTLGGSTVFSGLSEGDICTLSEAVPSNADSTSVSPNPVMVEAGNVLDVTLTHTYPAAGALEVFKETSGFAPPDGALFTVEITCSGAGSIVRTAPVSAGGSVVFDGLHGGDICAIGEPLSGAASSVAVSPNPVVIGSGVTASATITNSYTTTAGSIRIEKQVTGSPPPGEMFEVRIECDGILASALIPVGGSATFDSIPDGTVCTVTEPGPGGATSVAISPNPVVATGGSETLVTVTNDFTP